MSWQIRQAKAGDLPAILQIMADAKASMRANGFCQWADDYPAKGHIEEDLVQGVGYVLIEQGESLAYAAICFDGEPAYECIDGQWLSDQPYVVVHRLAISAKAKGRGLGRKFLKYAEHLTRRRGVRSVKIDTGLDNAPMQHVLQQCGFTRCGTIFFQNRKLLALEKLIG